MERSLLETVSYLFPALLAGVWLAVTHLLSRLGGWHRLAGRYRSPGPFAGRLWRFQSGRFNWVQYNRSLSVGADGKGLYLAPLFLIRPGHPPLWIPWEGIAMKSRKILAWTVVDLSFSEVPRTRLRISGRLWRRIDPGRSPGEARGTESSLPPKIEPR